MIHIRNGPSIPEDELVFVATRGGGPGGQHVNKVATRIELRFDVAGSPSLDDGQKLRLHEKLGGRISGEGVLRIVASSERSQRANREAALERFVGMLQRAFEEEAPRVPTRVPRAQKRRRLDEKKRRAETKRLRRGRA